MSGDRARWVEEYVSRHCFAPVPSRGLTFGAELELLAFRAESGEIAPIFGADDERCSLTIARQAGARLRWRESLSNKGVPRFTSVAGGSLTFEPGGQLEFASAVHGSVDAVLRELCTVETVLREHASLVGVELLSVGVDPFNGPAQAPLQLDAPRYARMAKHFESIGPAGARMMRQTASLQVNVGGISVRERWSVANALAPWLVALFANSKRYAGADTGFASYRAQTWREVDTSRTGVLGGSEPELDYTSFALAARAFLADDEARPFAEIPDSLATEEALAAHLSTLFPEVRPRGYLELRSLDAVSATSRAAALALIAGVIADATAAGEALELLGRADDALLARAGRDGGSEPRIAATAADLVAVASRGCARLGPDVVSEAACDALAMIQTTTQEQM